MRATTIIGGQISASGEIYPALSPLEMMPIGRSDLCSVSLPGPARLARSSIGRKPPWNRRAQRSLTFTFTCAH